MANTGSMISLPARAPIGVVAVEVEHVDDFFTVGTPPLLSTLGMTRGASLGIVKLFGNTCGAVNVNGLGGEDSG